MKKKIIYIVTILAIALSSLSLVRTIRAAQTHNQSYNIALWGDTTSMLFNDQQLWWDNTNKVLNIGQTGLNAGKIKLWGSTSGSTTIDAGTTGTPAISITATGAPRYCVKDAGFALATAGTNTTLAAATTFSYVSEIDIPISMTVTGISVLAGGTAGGANNWAVALFTSAGGTAVAHSASTTSASSTNAFLDLPFTVAYSATGPGQYWAEFQSDGTTDKIQTIAAANSWKRGWTQKPASTAFGTFPSLTPPSTFTADVGPIACLY